MVTERLAVHLLGDFRVSVGSRTIDEREWTLRKVKSLVKLLALAPHHRLHREHIIDRLWPDTGAEDGANNLHRVLYVARRILEPDLPLRRASSYLRLRHDMLLLPTRRRCACTRGISCSKTTTRIGLLRIGTGSGGYG